MKVKMKILSAAVGAALGVSALPAQAEEVLIPYWISADGVYTLLDIENFAPAAVDGAGNPLNHRLNYYWMTWDGQQGANDSNAGKCVHNDGSGTMTAFDMIFQTVADPADVGGLDLPGGIGDASVPAYYAPNPAQGFLVLGLLTGAPGNPPTVEGTLSAHVKILDLVGGVVVGYKALNDEFQVGGPPTPGDFGVSPAINHNNFTMSWWPTAWINTGWFVLATGNDMVSQPTNLWGPGVRLQSPPNINGVFDNDENFFSGDTRKFFNCMAFVTPNEILSPFQQVNTVNGGMKPTVLFPPAPVAPRVPDGIANGAVMFRYEITDVGLGTTTWWTHETGGPVAWPQNWAY